MSDTKPLLYLIAGARPNFMKLAPIARALDEAAGLLDYRIIHTGQHYDQNMSQVFFDELGIRTPDHYLQADSGSHARQTASIMCRFEEVCTSRRPDHVMVIGDVNSTLACGITAKKLGISLSHVEAGLRSRDMNMPEEINRIVTDSISDMFFVTEESGYRNLALEGKKPACIHFVGNVMIDNLFHQLDKLNEQELPRWVSDFKADASRYAVLTLHRPSNVDDEATLSGIVAAINAIAEDMPVVFPIHPRTARQLAQFGMRLSPGVISKPPLSYMHFLSLWKDARVVLTDSGGLQEETTCLGIPCLTLRDNTERPITLTEGTNTLVGSETRKILSAYASALRQGVGKQRIPKFWDGKASERIVRILTDALVSDSALSMAMAG